MRSLKNNINTFKQYIQNISLIKDSSARLTLFFKLRFLRFFENQTQGEKCFIHLIQLIIKPKTSFLVKLKLLMALHHVLMSNHPFSQVFIKYIPQILSAVNSFKEQNPSDSLIKSLFLGYSQFLTNICSKYQNYLTIKFQRMPCKELYSDTILMYLMINLLKSSFPLRNIFITLGRYYKEEFPIVIDVCETIANDLVQLYNSISIIISSFFDRKQKNITEDASEMFNIRTQTFLLNEQLSIIIKNRYFAEYVHVPKVNWIKCDLKQTSSNSHFEESCKNSNRKRIKTAMNFLQSFDINQFEQTYFSNYQKTEPDLQSTFG